MNAPQFGEREAGRDYPDRPAAFAVVARDSLIACVEVAWRNGGPKLDLPGGGIDEGETPAQAAQRECGEEAGLRVRVADAPFVCADHFFVSSEGKTYNTRGQFFAGQLEGESPELKVEDDHTLLWLQPVEALARLDRESHAWALTAWLRNGAG